jgi:hypothetical protein|tara:strand:+ start:3342 stop:3839 length:498 start_codon:yes stop_codon:yes gene_type:complete
MFIDSDFNEVGWGNFEGESGYSNMVARGNNIPYANPRNTMATSPVQTNNYPSTGGTMNTSVNSPINFPSKGGAMISSVNSPINSPIFPNPRPLSEPIAYAPKPINQYRVMAEELGALLKIEEKRIEALTDSLSELQLKVTEGEKDRKNIITYGLLGVIAILMINK